MKKGELSWVMYAVIVLIALVIIALILYKVGVLGTTPVLDTEVLVP